MASFIAVKHNCLITDGITQQRDIFYTETEVVNRSVCVFHFHTYSDVLLPQSELSERGSAGSPSGRKKQGRTCRGEVSLPCVSPCESAAPPSGWKPCRSVSTCRASHLMRGSTKQTSCSRNSITSTKKVNSLVQVEKLEVSLRYCSIHNTCSIIW